MIYIEVDSTREYGRKVETPEARTDWWTGADIARTLGAFAVVALHVSGYLVSARGTLPDNVAITGVLFQALFKFAVPLFVMVAGALHLEQKSESSGHFLRKRLSRIMIPLVFWTPVYALFSIYYRKDTPADLFVFIDQVARGRVYNHLYFLWLILGLYILTPYLRVWVAALGRRRLAQLTGLILLATLVDQGLRQYFGIDYSPTIVSWCAQFLGYYMLGYLLRPVRLGNRLPSAIVVFTAMAAATAVLWWSMPIFATRATGWPGSLFSPLVVIQSAAIFLICDELGRRWAPTRPRLMRAMRRTGYLSFGVYLIQSMMVAVLYSYAPLVVAAKSPLVWCIAATTAISVVSLGIVAAVDRVPGLRRIFGTSGGGQSSI